MPNILIIGATGYIGTALTSSLIRSGSHRVYGLARTPSKALSLQKDEVIPIEGSITNNNSLLLAIEKHQIDIVVDLSGTDESYILLESLKKLGKKRLEDAEKEGIKVQKLGHIYCSGTWVHGSSNKAVNDLTPVDVFNAPCPPARLTSWRPKLERAVLASSDVLDVMVIRPALVYGRSSAIWSIFFTPLSEAAKKGEKNISLPVEKESRPGLIHVDDVATGFHAAIDKLALISGTGVYPVFDLVTSQESMREILEFAAREMGFIGRVELNGSGEDLFAKAMCTSFNGCSGRARQILGWEPKRFGFVGGIDLFVKAWEGARL